MSVGKSPKLLRPAIALASVRWQTNGTTWPISKSARPIYGAGGQVMTDSDEQRDDLTPRDSSVIWIWLIAVASAVTIGVVFRFFS